jgi:hypothetical protein
VPGSRTSCRASPRPVRLSAVVAGSSSARAHASAWKVVSSWAFCLHWAAGPPERAGQSSCCRIDPQAPHDSGATASPAPASAARMRSRLPAHHAESAPAAGRAPQSHRPGSTARRPGRGGEVPGLPFVRPPHTNRWLGIRHEEITRRTSRARGLHLASRPGEARTDSKLGIDLCRPAARPSSHTAFRPGACSGSLARLGLCTAALAVAPRLGTMKRMLRSKELARIEWKNRPTCPFSRGRAAIRGA